MTHEEKGQCMLALVAVYWYSHAVSVPRNSVHAASNRAQESFGHHELRKPPLPEEAAGVSNRFFANSCLTEHVKLAVTSLPMKIHAVQRPSEMLLRDQNIEQHLDLVLLLHADPN